MLVYLRHADGVREEFWLDVIEKAKPHEAVLIVCGFMHSRFLARRAKRRGWAVTKESYLPGGIEPYGELVDP